MKTAAAAIRGYWVGPLAVLPGPAADARYNARAWSAAAIVCTGTTIAGIWARLDWLVAFTAAPALAAMLLAGRKSGYARGFADAAACYGRDG